MFVVGLVFDVGLTQVAEEQHHRDAERDQAPGRKAAGEGTVLGE